MRLVAIADLHAGSGVAVTTPANWGAPDDPDYPTRRALYGAYEAAAGGPWHRPDVLVVVGDAVDGQGRKKCGVEQWTTDPLRQVREAAKLIGMWDAREVYLLRGSDYHVDAAGIPIEELLGEECGARQVGGTYSGYDLTLRVEDVTFHCAHHLGGTRVWQYRGTALTRDMLLARLNDRLRGEVDKHAQAKVLLRAHVHYAWHVEADWQHGFSLPAWQARSPFMLRLSPHGMTPSIGFFGFEVNREDMRYEKHLWPIDAIQAPRVAVCGRGRDARVDSGAHRGGVRGRARTRADA